MLAGSSFANAEPFVIGEEGDTNRGFNFDGTIDEVRFSKTLRSNDWIRAQYLSMTDNYTWFGPEKGQCNFRSIGTRPNYGTGHAAGLGTTVTADPGLAHGHRLRRHAVAHQQPRPRRRDPDRPRALHGRGGQLRDAADAHDAVRGHHRRRQELRDPAHVRDARRSGRTASTAWRTAGPACSSRRRATTWWPITAARSGIAYNDSPIPGNADFTASVTIDGSVTDAVHTIMLTADYLNNNRGLAGAGTMIDNGNSVAAIRILDDFVNVSWLEIRGGLLTVDGIFVDTQGPSNGIKLTNLLIHDVPGDGIEIVDPDSIVDVYNTIIYSAAQRGILISPGALTASSRVRLLNNTIYNVLNEANIQSFGASNPTVLLRNNIARHYLVPAPSASSSDNLSMDATATAHSPAGGGEPNVTLAMIDFVNSVPATADLHLKPTSYARDKAANLSALFPGDIDDGPRVAPWDIGADEQEPGVAAGCPYGMGMVGSNLAPNPAFATLGGAGPVAQPAVGAGFVIHPSAPSLYAGDNVRPIDGEVAIFTSAYQWPSGGPPWTIDQAPFPGDPGLGVAAAGSFLVVNGNPFAPAPMMSWQTRNPISVTPSTTYTFFVYASNLISLTNPAVDPPRLVFRKSATSCVPGPCTPSDLNATPYVVPQETTADTWSRYVVNFTTGPAETQTFLSLWDAGISIFGVDLGLTQFGVYQCAPTTAVTLQSFVAVPEDRAVLLAWRTGSELTNLGFHVYRSLSENGPWTRLTASLIPGLGSSAVGQAYSFRDTGLTNGTRYFYRLDDVDASSKTTSHGPVSAVPSPGLRRRTGPAAAAAATAKKNGRGRELSGLGARGLRLGRGLRRGHGRRCAARATAIPRPSRSASLSRDSRSATLELRTGGFYALHTPSGAGEPAGTVRVFVPGFDFPQDDKAAALPIRRALTDAVVGRRVQLGGVRALDLASFKGLVPSALGKAEMQVGRDGTVRAARRARLARARPLPEERARDAPAEPLPGRDEERRRRDRAAALRCRSASSSCWRSGCACGCCSPGARRGRAAGAARAAPRDPASPSSRARSWPGSTPRAAGCMPSPSSSSSRDRGAASRASQLRLERQGEPVAFHLEPAASAFGPGSRLFFYADKTAASTDFSARVAYELVRSERRGA